MEAAAAIGQGRPLTGHTASEWHVGDMSACHSSCILLAFLQSARMGSNAGI